MWTRETRAGRWGPASAGLRGWGDDERSSWCPQTVLRQDPGPRNQQPGASLPQAHRTGRGWPPRPSSSQLPLLLSHTRFAMCPDPMTSPSYCHHSSEPRETPSPSATLCPQILSPGSHTLPASLVPPSLLASLLWPPYSQASPHCCHQGEHPTKHLKDSDSPAASPSSPWHPCSAQIPPGPQCAWCQGQGSTPAAPPWESPQPHGLGAKLCP